MKITDNIYGQCDIDDKLAISIIKSPAMQRLRGINQWGYTKVLYGEVAVNRFDHSVGVYLLLKKYNAPREEQIAGLIHDVSHSSFSHTIDYLLAESSTEKMSHQDNIFQQYLLKTNIPQIINKYGVGIQNIIDPKKHPLLEQSQPKLCADRIDYLLRDALALNEITMKDVNTFLAHLCVIDSSWVFNQRSIASKFAKLMRKMNIKYYANFHRCAVMHHVTAEYLRVALQKNYIDMSDIYRDDKHVLNKLSRYHSKDKELRLKFNDMNNVNLFCNDPQNYDHKIIVKSRAIDPNFLLDDQVMRLSDIDPKWRAILQNDLKPKTYFLKRKNNS